MQAINHALTGAIIGLTVSNPAVAVLVAFASHFVCDAIPHSGVNDAFLKSRPFKVMLVTDASLCVGLVGVLFVLHPAGWFGASLCAFVATSPDLWNIKFFMRVTSDKPYKPGLIKRITAKIQWFERPIGALVEVAWACSAIFVLWRLM